MKAQCRNCMKRVPEERTDYCSRTGGGTYRRGSRQYSARICLDCINDLLTYITPGHWTVSRWSISGLRYAKERIEKRLGVT
jgi:hypothetical protein